MASKKLEYNFIGEPSDKLKCLICLDVAKDLKQHETCGKIFCKVCIEKNKDKPCPSCRAMSLNYFTDTRGEKILIITNILLINNYITRCSRDSRSSRVV